MDIANVRYAWQLEIDIRCADDGGLVNPASSFHRVQFPTPDTGYITNTIVPDMAGYQFTKDGGKTWIWPSTIPRTIIDIKFITPDCGFFFNNSYPLQRLHEGGIYQLIKIPAVQDTWYHRFLSVLTSETRIVDINLLNDTLAYAATTFGELLEIKFPKSKFRTAISSKGIVPLEMDVTAISFVDADKGWFVTYEWNDQFYPKGTRLYRTQDAGKSWTAIYSTKDYRAKHLFALDSHKLWYTAGACIFKPIDAGSNWSKVRYRKGDQTKFEPTKIFFIDENRGFLLSLVEVYETDDGGSTWHRSMRVMDLKDITITDKKHLWAVGSKKLYRLDL